MVQKAIIQGDKKPFLGVHEAIISFFRVAPKYYSTVQEVFIPGC